MDLSVECQVLKTNPEAILVRRCHLLVPYIHFGGRSGNCCFLFKDLGDEIMTHVYSIAIGGAMVILATTLVAVSEALKLAEGI